jgi:endonuclease/exonuclease/phosphatase (EEP) superfamily protein YafD
MLLAVGAHAWQIFPYTTLSSEQVLPANGSGPDLRILVANVLQGNRDSGKLLARVREWRPDVVLLAEADPWWTRELDVLEEWYPHTVLHPLTNTYGLNLYSRFPLTNAKVRFLTDPGVPSIRARMNVHGRNIRFYGVHPRPPGRMEVPSEGINDSGQRDAELILVAKEVRETDEPVVVAGDFNDVAWSHTTRLFQRTSRLLDPRVGRGLYNSYHVNTPLLRFPLDHLFNSDDFKLVGMQRLDPIGSDHFPILISLRLQPDAPAHQEAPPPKPGDEAEAAETIQEERSEDRQPR